MLLLSYRPHDGHADQMRQLTVAAALARSLHRHLLLPPLLHHLDSPSCPRYKVDIASRPAISSVLDLSALGVQTTEVPHALPSCSRANGSCPRAIDPSWMQLGHRGPSPLSSSRWLHFESMLFTTARRGCRFANWEQALPF